MSWLSFFGIGKRKQHPLGRPPTQRIYIVDGTGMVDNRSRNGNSYPSPRDHYLVLRNLAQFVGRERISLVAVFIGRPLREAGEGGVYKGVTVHYAENTEALAAKMLKLARGNIRTKDVILITGAVELEREAVALNMACLRPSTLKKAIDDRDDRGDRDGDRQPRYGRSRPPMGRRHEPERPQQAEAERKGQHAEPDRRSEAESQPVNNPAVPPPPEKHKPEPGVLDLIDPV